MLAKSEYKESLAKICDKCTKTNRCRKICKDCDKLVSFIDKTFDLQLTASECDLIISVLEPLEVELGMDIALLISKIYTHKNNAPKEKGVVGCALFD